MGVIKIWRPKQDLWERLFLPELVRGLSITLTRPSGLDRSSVTRATVASGKRTVNAARVMSSP